MAAPTFSISEALRFGWRTTKEHFWLFLQVVIVVAVIAYGPSLIAQSFDRIELPTLAVLFFLLVGIVFWALQLLISIGIVKIVLAYVSGQEGRISDLFSGGRHIVRFFFGSLLYGLAVVVGLLLLVVPGIVLAVRLQFYQYLIVDKNMGPLEALRTSWDMTDGSFWGLVLLWLTALGINFLGVLALGIGLLLSMPTTVLAGGWVYRRLVREAHA